MVHGTAELQSLISENMPQTLMAHHDACTLPWKSSSARMCRTRRVRHSLERAKTASGANYVFLWLFWFVRFGFVKDGSKMVMKLTDLGFVAMPPMTGYGFIISSWDYPSLSLSAIIWHLACLVSKRTNMSQHHSYRTLLAFCRRTSGRVVGMMVTLWRFGKFDMYILWLCRLSISKYLKS